MKPDGCGKTVRDLVHLVSHGADEALGELFDKYSQAGSG